MSNYYFDEVLATLVVAKHYSIETPEGSISFVVRKLNGKRI
jgi:hypothetical protein